MSGGMHSDGGHPSPEHPTPTVEHVDPGDLFTVLTFKSMLASSDATD